MAQPTRTRKNQPDTFYEAMPATADAFPIDSDQPEEEPLSDRDRLTIDETRTTAIITLILTALVAIGLALLLWRGLDTIKGAVPNQQPNNSGSIEL